MKKTAQKIVTWLQKQVKAAHSKGTVLGISGGLDSSVTAVLCKRAFPHNTLGLLMPCYSNSQDTKDAKLLAKNFDIPIKEINLCQIFEKIVGELDGEETKCKKIEANLALANIKARLRMVALYYYANKLNYLVVGSGNKSEIMVGYFTKYGDGGADILPFGDLFKTQVKELAEHLKIPKEIIQKKPSAGLWKGQTDEKEIGMSYRKLDEVLSKIESKKTPNLDSKSIQKVQSMIKKSEHKRRLPKICKI